MDTILRRCFTRCLSSDDDLKEMLVHLRMLERKASVRRRSLGSPVGMERAIRWASLERLPSDEGFASLAPALEKADEQMGDDKDPKHMLQHAIKNLVMIMRLSNNIFNIEKARRTLLSNGLKEALTPYLPSRLCDREWHQIFSTDEHGTLTRAYQLCRERNSPTVLLVMDTNRHIFGAFSPVPWAVQPRLGYYGNGEVFLFRALPTLEIFKPTFEDDQYILSASDSLALGGGGTFGLWLDRDCLHGASGPCRTFGNPGPLSATANFDIVSVEIWELSVQRHGSHSATETLAFGGRGGGSPPHQSSRLSATSKWAAPPPSRL